MLSRLCRRHTWGGMGWPDHPAGCREPSMGGAEPIASSSKATLGSSTLRQPGSSGDPQHHPGTLQLSPTEGLFLSPAFVFYLVLLFSPLWSFVPACPLFRRLWFLFPLMLCHSLHLGAFLRRGFEAAGCFLWPGCAWQFYPFSLLVHSSGHTGPDCLQIPICLGLVPGFPCLYVLS